MAYEVVVPRLGLTMEGGTIVEWYKQDGEYVEAGEKLFAIETDKVVVDVEAPVSGVLFRVRDLPSEELPIGTVIGYILAPGEEVPLSKAGPAAASTPVSTEPSASAPVTPAPRRVPAEQRKLSSPAARRRAKELGIDWRTINNLEGGPILVSHVEKAAREEEQAPRIDVSPVARRLAEAAGVDLAELAAWKPGERILRQDVEAAIAARELAGHPPPRTPGVGRGLPITSTRRTIADRMIESARTTASVTLVSEADASDLVALREQFKATLLPRRMDAPTYTVLVVKLVAVALEEHPLLNSSWIDDQIVTPASIHIGVAVDTEAGLLVPVIRDVPNKSLQQIAEEAASLAERARARQLTPDDLQGGTFTITNLGMHGIDAFTPIINPPQCAILGIGRVSRKPSVYKDEVVPREIMTLSLTFDHRVVDGAPAARFLNMVREYVEQPYLWLGR